ncbi:hypothetical protein UFOVP1655_158 [uncultured Caudovirales phage]|uniref:Uncharacterized protein n=1 Tax=uncultured Caudovirales phage TaxID=2100421 RepID=A0A6J5T4D3_9CAUD|nr:hypothetical protein UFOVP1655_158 [uncultured Caudovirales phage]
MSIEKVITVGVEQLVVVKARIEKMNKKALKLGIEPIVIVSEVERNIKEKRVNQWTGRSVEVLIPVIDLAVVAEEIKYGNYSHVATLDHTVGNLPIVKTVPNQFVPVEYHNADSNCVHCNIKRHRNNTYIFKDDDGYKQVGSTCLKDFFGINPVANLDWFSDFNDIKSDDYIGGGNSEPMESNVTILSLALAVVAEKGYVSKKNSDSHYDNTGIRIKTTSDEVKWILNPPRNLDNEDRDYLKSVWNKADELKLDAEAMIQWGINKFSSETSDYSHNMTIFLSSECTKAKYYGYLVSVIGIFNADKVKTIKKDNVIVSNEFIGVVGDKVEVNVIVDKVIPIEGTYGRTYINLMSEANTGNSLVWFSSNYVLDDGDEVKLKGTIKALNERDGTNQTVLTRCKVI